MLRLYILDNLYLLSLLFGQLFTNLFHFIYFINLGNSFNKHTKCAYDIYILII